MDRAVNTTAGSGWNNARETASLLSAGHTYYSGATTRKSRSHGEAFRDSSTTFNSQQSENVTRQ